MAEASLARANAAIGDWFGRLPVAPCEVVPMPAHEEKHSTIAYYREPAADGSRPGQYYINTYAPETRPRYEAETLAFHESVPGHHLQLAIMQELTDLPDFRRFNGCTAFIEGWGLYTERLSEEMGLLSGELDHFGILSFDAWRASRLVVDTGIHALGWPRQRAIDFMTAHAPLGLNNIANEVDRYIAWPGQALAYKLGQLELLRLRAEARARQGHRFDIRRFHDVVLGEGALPLARPAHGGGAGARLRTARGASRSVSDPPGPAGRRSGRHPRGVPGPRAQAASGCRRLDGRGDREAHGRSQLGLRRGARPGEAPALGVRPPACGTSHPGPGRDARGPAGPLDSDGAGARLDFGRYEGWTLGEVARRDPEYLDWLRRHASGARYRDAIDILLRRRRGSRAAGTSAKTLALSGETCDPSASWHASTKRGTRD